MTTPTYPTLRQGSTGPTVSFLQKNLITLGYGSLLAPYGADGVFGSKTTQAVRDLQTKHSLTVDGVVGALTWGKILSLVPSSDILVNTIQATIEATPTPPKPPAPSLPAPSLPEAIEVKDERVPPSKSSGMVLIGVIAVGAWFMLKPGRRRR